MFVVIHILEYFQHIVNINTEYFQKKEGEKMYSKIKMLCKKNNISVTELERTLEFSRGSICKWDANIPSITKVKAVADYFGVTVDELMKEGDGE